MKVLHLSEEEAEILACMAAESVNSAISESKDIKSLSALNQSEELRKLTRFILSFCREFGYSWNIGETSFHKLG